MNEQLTIKYIPLSQAVLFDRNAKKHDIGAISQSIAKYGFKNPPKWEPKLNDGEGGIVAGNGRIEALQKMLDQGIEPPRGIAVLESGEWAVPIVFGVDSDSEIEARAFAIDDNVLTIKGGEFTALDISKMFDADGYLEELQALADEEELPIGVDGDDLDFLLKEIGEGLDNLNQEEDEEELNELLDNVDKIEPRVKLGEIWQLGRHKICCGDSTIEKNVRALLGDRFNDVGMVWADPPYGISIVATNGYVGGGDCNRTSIKECQDKKRLGTTYGSKPFGSNNVRGSDGASNVVKVNSYAPIIGDETVDTAVDSCKLAISIAPKAVHVWWGANYYANCLPPSSCWIVWDKENTGNFADAELAWSNHPSAVRIFKHMWNGMIKASEHGERRVHPTQKPIALCEWVFDKYGNSNDLIFDPFLGSAPSIIAAQKMEGDRTVYGFELSPEYCTVILDRFTKFTGQEPKLVGNLPN